MEGIIIKGIGAYTPSKIVTNNDLSKIVETSDEWIRSRTGIKERRISQGEDTSYMGIKASEKAIEGIVAEKLIAEVKNHGFKDVSYLPNLNDSLSDFDDNNEKHTIIMTFGAGSITNFSYIIADYLKERGK